MIYEFSTRPLAFSAFFWFLHSLTSISYTETQQPELEEIRSNNMQLVEKITEVQRERAELEHENKCLLQEMEAKVVRIKELEIQNKNFRENLERMSEELACQQKIMKELNDKLLNEKEQLKSKLLALTEVSFNTPV